MDTPTIFNDILIGDDTAEIVHALAGNDIIDGKGGADQLFGDEGDGTLSRAEQGSPLEVD